MTQPTVIERLSDLQAKTDRFHAEERALAELTAALDEIAQRRADAQERVEQLRPSAELFTRANTVLDELLKSHEDAQPRSPFAGFFDSLFSRLPAAPTTEVVPAEVPTPVSEPVPEVVEQSAEPEAVPQPELVEPAPAGQEDSGLEADAPTDVPEPTAVTTAYRVRAYLALHPESTAKDIAEQLQVPQKTVASTVSRMASAGQAEMIDDSWPPIYKLKGTEYTPPKAEPEPGEPVVEEATLQDLPPVASPSPKAATQKQTSGTRAGKLRDVADRQAIQGRPPAQAPLAPNKVKPVTESDERAVLAALIARPNGKGSAALLSGKAGMATSRVTEVLEHLAGKALVVRPVEGEHIWSRK